jgi:hypothetical protein
MDGLGQLIIVRTGHVIAADRTDQFAAAGLEPLRTDRAIPRDIVARSQLGLGGLGSLRLSGRQFLFRSIFHGSKVIAHPPEREKRIRHQTREARGGLPSNWQLGNDCNRRVEGPEGPEGLLKSEDRRRCEADTGLAIFDLKLKCEREHLYR